MINIILNYFKIFTRREINLAITITKKTPIKIVIKRFLRCFI